VRYAGQTHALASPKARTNRTKKTKNVGPQKAQRFYFSKQNQTLG
jgi:hypothetical protein